MGKTNKSGQQTPEKKQLSPESVRLATSLVINSVLLLFVYYGAMATNVPVIASIVTIAYMVILGGFLIAYIAYNRAFSRKGITPDMLPQSWSREQKQEYIADGENRIKRSRWMLTVIIPFLVTFIADALYLFVWNGLLANLFK